MLVILFSDIFIFFIPKGVDPGGGGALAGQLCTEA